MWKRKSQNEFLRYGSMLMNSRSGPPIFRGGPPLGTISMDLAVPNLNPSLGIKILILFVEIMILVRIIKCPNAQPQNFHHKENSLLLPSWSQLSSQCIVHSELVAGLTRQNGSMFALNFSMANMTNIIKTESA